MDTPTFASPTIGRRFLGTAFAIAVLPALLGGCAADPLRGKIPPTVDFLTTRPIAVTVDRNGDELVISISEDPIVVRPNDRKDIQWFISGSGGWRFDGIVVSNPGSELQDTGGDDNNHKWKNNHTRQGDYKYTIKFKKGPDRMLIDPTIKNQ